MNTNGKNNAIIFARVSSKEQEETGYSLPAQEKFLQEYARRNDVNLIVKKIFQISESASGTIDRKIFKEMLGYVRKNEISAIIVETTDRLTRNFGDVPLIDEWIMESENHHIHLAKEGCVLNKNSKSHEWFMWRVKVATAEYYTKLLSENVKKGQKEKITQGWLPTKPPLGYVTVGEKGHKIHVIDEKTSPYIKRMFVLYATGNYSLGALTKKMYELGFRSRGGGRVVKSKIHKLLSDPFYYGKFEWKDNEYKGNQQAVITKDLFDQVKSKLTRKTSPYYNKHNKELKGKVLCGNCGKTVTWECQKGHWYGGCKQCKAQLATSKRYVRQEYIESVLMTKIASIAPRNERILAVLTKALRESHEEEINYHEANVRGITASLERIQQRKKTMYDDKLDGRITTEFYDQKLDEFNKEEEILTESLRKLKSDNTEYYKVGSAVHELAQKAGKIYASSKATTEERRLLLSYAFESISVNKGDVIPQYTKAFTFLAEWMPKVNKNLELLQNPIKIKTRTDQNELAVAESSLRLPNEKMNSRTAKNPLAIKKSGSFAPTNHSLLPG